MVNFKDKLAWSIWTKVNGKLTFGRLMMDETDLDSSLRLCLEAVQLERYLPTDEDYVRSGFRGRI